MHGSRLGAVVRARRGLVAFLVPIVALAAAAMAIGAPAAGADTSPFPSAAVQAGLCFGYPDLGGCAAGLGGTETARPGSTTSIGVALPSFNNDVVFLDGTRGAPGIVFPSDASQYQVHDEATGTVCPVSQVYAVESSVAFEVLPKCSGNPLVVLVDDVVLPPAAGTMFLDVGDIFSFVTQTNTVNLANAPSSPTNPGVNRGDHSITVSWGVPDSDGGSPVTGYRVYCAVGTPSTADAPVATTDASTLSATISSLSLHTTYSCFVTAVNAGAEGPPSSVVSAAPYGVASAPRSFSVTPGDGLVSLSWERPADFGGTPITGYNAYCSTTSPPPVDADHACGHFGPGQHLGTVRGLTDGVTYYVALTAANAAGESGLSDIASATPFGPPTRPWAVRTITAGRRALVVRWRVPGSDGGAPILHYDVYCSTDNPPSTAGSPSAVVTKNVVRFPHLTTGTTYYCVVTATNEHGTSPVSSVASGVPL